MCNWSGRYGDMHGDGQVTRQLSQLVLQELRNLMRPKLSVDLASRMPWRSAKTFWFNQLLASEEILGGTSLMVYRQ